jgi:hypothetical protein
VNNPKKKFIVTYTAQYDVEADSSPEAMDIGQEIHAHLPDGFWEVAHIDNQETE